MIITFRYGEIRIVKEIFNLTDVLIDALMAGDDWYAIYQLPTGEVVAHYQGSCDEIVEITVI